MIKGRPLTPLPLKRSRLVVDEASCSDGSSDEESYELRFYKHKGTESDPDSDDEEFQDKRFASDEHSSIADDEDEITEEEVQESADSWIAELKKVLTSAVKKPVNSSHQVTQTVAWVITQHLGKDLKKAVFDRSRWELLARGLFERGDITYCGAGFEKCPTTGEFHMQGYIQYPPGKKKRFNAVLRMWTHSDLKHPRIAPAGGTSDDNLRYIKKLDDVPNDYVFELGVIRNEIGRQHKAQFEQTLDLALSGKFEEISAQHQLQYFRAIHALNFSQDRKYQDNPNFLNYWLVGSPGVGKSRLAREICSDGPIYFKCAQTKWFDDYRHEPNIVIDDLEKDAKYQGHLLKMVCDRYPCRVEVKGASTLIRPNKIVVTSNYTISEIFEDSVLCAAVSRRFRCIHIGAYSEALAKWHLAELDDTLQCGVVEDVFLNYI